MEVFETRPGPCSGVGIGTAIGIAIGFDSDADTDHDTDIEPDGLDSGGIFGIGNKQTRRRPVDSIGCVRPLDIHHAAGAARLKLESAKGPVEMLVIDYIQRPSDN